jgi:uncharacterized membrane protein YebE (DUF533 family)
MIEVLTKFNPYAMIKPSTEQEYLALLDEAIRMVDELNDDLEASTKFLESR